jgi:hypothetical protein
MGHDTTKFVMGTVQESGYKSSNHAGSSTTYPAGTALRLKSDNSVSVTKADGNFLGVSLGEDLSDTSRVAYVFEGRGVAILLTSGLTPVIGASVWIDDVTGKANIVDDGSVTTTITNAHYMTGAMKGVKADGTEVDIALIDMKAGL